MNYGCGDNQKQHGSIIISGCVFCNKKKKKVDVTLTTISNLTKNLIFLNVMKIQAIFNIKQVHVIVKEKLVNQIDAPIDLLTFFQIGIFGSIRHFSTSPLSKKFT